MSSGGLTLTLWPHYFERIVMVDIGEQIRQERLANKLTLKELAERANIGTMTLQRIETGKTIPNVHVLIRLAQELDKSINDFLGEPEGFCTLIKKKNRKKISQNGLNVSVLSPRAMEKKGVSASFLVEKAGTTLGPQKNANRWVFVYQINGQVSFEYMGKKYKMTGGDCVYFDGNGEHIVTIEKDTESLLVTIKK